MLLSKYFIRGLSDESELSAYHNCGTNIMNSDRTCGDIPTRSTNPAALSYSRLHKSYSPFDDAPVWARSVTTGQACDVWHAHSMAGRMKIQEGTIVHSSTHRKQMNDSLDFQRFPQLYHEILVLRTLKAEPTRIFPASDFAGFRGSEGCRSQTQW